MGEKTNEYYFKELLDYVVVKETSKFKNSIFYFKDNECYFEYDQQKNIFFVNEKLHEVLNKKYGMDVEMSRYFIKEMIKEHWNIDVEVWFVSRTGFDSVSMIFNAQLP